MTYIEILEQDMKKKRYTYLRKTYRFKDSNEYEYTGLYNYGAKGEKREQKKKATPEQIARQNQINREKKMRRLLKKNFKRGDWWMTLKYPQGSRKELEEVLNDLGKFIRNVGAAYKRRGYPFQVGIPDRGG